jgi:hypothetical protein
MAGFDDLAFSGDRWANVYDEHRGDRDLGAAVEFPAKRRPRLSLPPASLRG